MADIRGVEIFRSGKWNGDSYSNADLDEMVAAFPRVGFDPPVKLGHDKTVGGRAFGWVRNLRRIGDKLVADLHDVPAEVFRVIKQRGLDTVSSEIFWNFKRGGALYRRVLKGVALLGAEIPAVAGLAPLRTVVNTSGTEFMACKEYTSKFVWHADDMVAVDNDPGTDMDRVVKSLAFDRNLDYMEAFQRILSSPQHADLVSRYAQSQGTQVSAMKLYGRPDTSDPDELLGLDVDAAVRKYQAAHPDTAYTAALDAVLEANPALRESYGDVQDA